MRNLPSLPGPRLIPFPPQLSGPIPQLEAARQASREQSAPIPVQAVPAAHALAHDARNALTALRLIGSLLDAPGVLPARHTHLAVELQAVEQTLSELVERFAALGGTPHLAPRMHENQGSMDASEALQRCLPLLRAAAGLRTVVHASAQKDLPPLRLSDEDLRRVLTNLVKNASEAMPEGGTVTITARRALSLTSPAVLVHIGDDGPGIPAFALGQIFQPGFSSKASGPAPRGLGLSIVRELVEAAGGTVKVASRRRRGTTFELRIPCREKAR